jgi:4-amino-4-deoxy-L-arabinose transferase-like glycosyltransferase
MEGPVPATDLAPTRRLRALEALGIAALALVLNLAGNGRMGLWDRDEPRYAECTREMRASGDFIHPKFNAEPRYQKPVLIYWLMLAGTAVGGDNPFGARLVSALAGASACLLVWRFGGRMFGPRIGRIAALILATAPIVVINSKLATTDATLALFLIACQFSLWELSRGPSPRAAAVFWTCLALATLTKGPVGIAMIAISGLVSWAMGGPSSCWGRLHWRWGIAGFLLIAAPWFVAIGIVTHWDFYRVAIGSQVIHRVTTGMEQHGGFPGYYPATTLLTFYPWSALLPAAILAGFAKRKSNPILGFLLGWAIGPMILLECVKTKLVHYYLPAYPACALLIAWLAATIADAEINLRRWPLGRLASGLLAGNGLALTVLALGGAMVLPWSLKWPCLAIAVIVAGGTLFSAECFRNGRAERAVFGLAGTWGVVLFLVGAWLLPSAEPYRLPQVVARRLGSLADQEHARPLLATFQEPSMIYEMGRPTPVMQDRAWLHDLLRKEGAAISPLSKFEMNALAKDRNLSLEVKETVAGFNLSKGRSETLHMVIIRPQAHVPDMARRVKKTSDR